jgi:hypothetical protein
MGAKTRGGVSAGWVLQVEGGAEVCASLSLRQLRLRQLAVARRRRNQSVRRGAQAEKSIGALHYKDLKCF